MSVSTVPTKPGKAKADKLNSYPFWSPRFWHGMRFRGYLDLMWRNRWRVHPLRWPMALGLLPITASNSVMYRLQQVIYGRRIAATEIKDPPIFIIGHWRSGTTYLHELMACDDRLAYPSTYECFVPHHFLVTGWYLPKMIWFLLPSKRPMDNMSAGFDRPQEDEFAMCAMNAPTPYFRMAFPNNPPPYHELLEMADVDERDLNKFRASLEYFTKALTLSRNKRLMMKSPPHTGRIELLADMFPGARFIHITRNPYAIFASTRRLWQALDAAQGFQIPKHENLDEYILDCFESMYRGFESQRPRVDPAQICDVKYEELVQDPVESVRSLYEKLNLGDFEHMRAKLEKYVLGLKGYQPNRHHLAPDLVQRINARWESFFERYGYEMDCDD